MNATAHRLYRTAAGVALAWLTVGIFGCSHPAPNAAAVGQASPEAAVASALQATSATARVTPDVSATLSSYVWQLATATNASGHTLAALFARPDKPLQIDFTAHALAVSNTCNRMRATYALSGNRMRIANLAATLMACPEAKLMALDSAAANALSGTSVFTLETRLTPPTLALVTPSGDRLTFTGIPTAATRFGSTGETIFLDIAPATRPCHRAGTPTVQCLYVRELHYNVDGVREGHPGPWHILAEPIEGYTHEAGVANVLRVKRYTITQPPAGGASTAYVLDMVVESHAPQHP